MTQLHLNSLLDDNNYYFYVIIIIIAYTSCRYPDDAQMQSALLGDPQYIYDEYDFEEEVSPYINFALDDTASAS